MAHSSNAASASAVADTPWDAAAVYNPATAAPSIGSKRKWHNIQETMQLTLKGGYMVKAESVETHEFILNGESQLFVHVHKKLDWLCKMAGGPLKRAGKILEEIRDEYYAHEVEDADGKSAVADADADPMDQCDSPERPERATPTPTAKCHRSHRMQKRATGTKRHGKRGTARTAEVPLVSRSAAPKATATKIIGVNIVGANGKGKMWLLHSDIPWLVAYLADEIATGGVDTAPADQSAVADGSSLAGLRANYPDVPGLCIRLKPVAGNLDEYEALFVDGPLQGSRLTSKVSTMTQDKWDRLQATAESWQCPAPDFNSPAVERHHKVSAVIQLLQQAMATKLAQERGG